MKSRKTYFIHTVAFFIGAFLRLSMDTETLGLWTFGWIVFRAETFSRFGTRLVAWAPFRPRSIYFTDIYKTSVTEKIFNQLMSIIVLSK